MKLPFKRFVKQVSSGGDFSKYGYIDMMQRNAAALAGADWREASCSPDEVTLTVGQVTRTDGVLDGDGNWTRKPSYTAWIDDRYDAYKQAGDGVSRNATVCGYAGCVAYRFTLPTENQSALNAITLGIQRDRYLRTGVRILTVISNEERPGSSWGFSHGTSITESVAPEEAPVGVKSWGFLAQPDVPHLTKSRAMDGTFTYGSESAPAFGEAVMRASRYLYVFLVLNDYADYWEMYSKKEARNYFIEGSAKLTPSLCDFEFASPETMPPDEDIGWIGGTVLENGMKTCYSLLAANNNVSGAAIWGELYDASPTSAIFCQNGAVAGWSSMFAVMMNALKSAPGRFMYEKDPGGHSSYSNRAAKVEVRDFNDLAAVKGGTTARYGLFVLGRSHEEDTGWSFDVTGADDGTGGNAAVSVNRTCALYLGYQPILVPAGAARYSRMKITSLYPDGGIGYGFVRIGVELDINVWHVKSLSATGSLDWLALCALAQNPAFFTAAEPKIAGSISTAGDMVVALSAEASLVAQFDPAGLGEWNKNKTSHEIGVGEVKPGELIVLAPNIRRIFPDETAVGGNTSSPGFTPNGRFFYYGSRFAGMSSAAITSKYPGMSDSNEAMALKLRVDFV